jgi:glycerol-3-phosphate acyltransferase PlsY
MFEIISPTYALIAIVGGYLLGSIPFGIIVTGIAGAGDLRQIGSGNIGATNVLRTGRKGLALVTLLGDGGKGALAVFAAWLATRRSPVEAQALLTALAGSAAFLGHLFPVWLKFRGGKGVATFMGTMLAAAWPAGLMAAATWLIVFFVFRISSLAALAAAALAPLFVLLADRPRPAALMALFMAILIYVRHHENIGRLLRGAEPRFGNGKTPAEPPA